MANLKSQTAKKKLLKEDPPTASSSDEEVETSSGEEEEQISDSKIPSTQALKSPSAVSAAAKEDSDSDSGSETGSDSESEPPEKAVSGTAVKSNSSEKHEPKIHSTKTLKPPSAASVAAKQDSGSEADSGSESEPEQPEKAIPVTVNPAKSKKKEVNDSPAVKSVKKRGNEGTSTTEGDAKRARKVSGDEEEKKSGEDNKKPPFQRLWSEEDEISLLQGMIDLKAETGTSPFDDMNGFYDKVKKSISFDASKSQFGDKIRSLKKNYFAGKKKSIESSHDKKCLGLVKYIWGSDGLGLESAAKSNKKVEKNKEVKGSGEIVESAANSSLVKSKKVEKKKEDKGSDGKGKKVEEDKEEEILGVDFEKSFLVRSIVSLGVDECSVKRKWSKVPLESKKRIEEMFKLVEAKDYESLLMKADILKEVTSVLSEAV